MARIRKGGSAAECRGECGGSVGEEKGARGLQRTGERTRERGGGRRATHAPLEDEGERGGTSTHKPASPAPSRTHAPIYLQSFLFKSPQ